MTSMAPVKTIHQPNIRTAFDREAETVLEELQPALAGIIEQLRPPVRRASQLRQRLGLSQKVSWSLFNAATAGDPRSLASLLPGRRGMEGFFSAAARHGVRPELVERARAAFDAFEESVARHAGRRENFEAMISERGVGGGEVDLKNKRAAFRANALLWGRQVQVDSTTLIAHPGSDPKLMDVVLLRGIVGLQRTRRQAALRFSQTWRRVADSDAVPPHRPEPLDPRDSGPHPIGLLRDFCSHPLPEFRSVDEPGYHSLELVSDSVGATSEVTYFTGVIMRGGEHAAEPELTISRCMTTPAQACVLDFLKHKDLSNAKTPEVRVCSTRPDGSPSESDLLPLNERAEYLGEGIDAARAALVPRYRELLAYATERLGWKPDEFRVYRCRVDYPVLYSWIRMTLR